MLFLAPQRKPQQEDKTQKLLKQAFIIAIISITPYVVFSILYELHTKHKMIWAHKKSRDIALILNYLRAQSIVNAFQRVQCQDYIFRNNFS